MSADIDSSLSPNPQVHVENGQLVIREFAVAGSALAAALQAAEDGQDLEPTVRQMLDIGGAILLHGTARGTVDAVAAEVNRLLSAIGEQRQRHEAARSMGDRIAAKGLDYEDLLEPMLAAAFAAHGDVLIHTGTEKGVADDLVGDFVLELNPRDSGGRDLRIVIEAKDRKLSMPKALAELDDAMINRDAQAAVIIFASPAQAPLAGQPLRAVHGNRILLVYDKDERDSLALDVGCQLARAFALLAEPEDLSLDRGMLAERLAQLVNVIDRASAIKRGVSTARRGLNAAEDAYNEMNIETHALLYELQDRLGDD